MGGLYYFLCKQKTAYELRIMDWSSDVRSSDRMLARLGIAARPALVSSVFGDLLQDRLPTLGAFDHVIVEATIDGTDYWLDGTTAGTHIEDLADEVGGATGRERAVECV